MDRLLSAKRSIHSSTQLITFRQCDLSFQWLEGKVSRNILKWRAEVTEDDYFWPSNQFNKVCAEGKEEEAEKYIKLQQTIQLFEQTQIKTSGLMFWFSYLVGYYIDEENNSWHHSYDWLSLTSLDLLFFLFIYFTLQYCIGFAIHWLESTMGCTCIPHAEPCSHLPPHTIPLGHPSAPAPSILYHALNLDWWFVSCMILYMFQCHSPKSSHPLPLPQSPKHCSIHLCLFCCLTFRVIVTIFLNSVSVLVYCIGVLLSH